MFTLFCGNCGRYLAHHRICPKCGWARPDPEATPALDLPGAGTVAPTLVLVGRGTSATVRWVVFPWRDASGLAGGVVAVDPDTWQEVWRYPTDADERGVCAAVESPIAAIGGRLVFADRVGCIHVVDAGPDGVQAARRALATSVRGRIEHAPLALGGNTPLAVAATATGHVVLLDLAHDLVVADVVQLRAAGRAHVRVAAAPARIHRPGGAQASEFLVAALESIEGTLRQEGGLYRVWLRHEELQYERVRGWSLPIYATPIIEDNRALIVDYGSRDHGSGVGGSCAWIDIASGPGQVVVAGTPPSDGKLRSSPAFDGRRDRRALWLVSQGPSALWCLEADSLAVRGSWAPDTGAPQHAGVTGAPVLLMRHDLVLVAVERGGVAAFEAETAQGAIQPVWTWWPPDGHDDMRGDRIAGIAAHGDLIFVAMTSGRVLRVPYFGGDLDWLEARAEKSRDGLLLAAVRRHRATRWTANKAADRAVALELKKSGQGLLAAQVRLLLDDIEEAAEIFESVGAWREAAACWYELEEPEEARRCNREAAAAERLPWIELVSGTESALFKVGEVTSLILRFRNIMPTKARSLSAEFWQHGAKVDLGVGKEFRRRELSNNGRLWKVELNELRPAEAGRMQLSAALRYKDDDLQTTSLQEFSVVIEVAAKDQPAQVTNISAEQWIEKPDRVEIRDGTIELIRPSLTDRVAERRLVIDESNTETGHVESDTAEATGDKSRRVSTRRKKDSGA